MFPIYICCQIPFETLQAVAIQVQKFMILFISSKLRSCDCNLSVKDSIWTFKLICVPSPKGEFVRVI